MDRVIASRRSIASALCLVSMFLNGCGRKTQEQGLVLVTPSVTAPPILRSEADQLAIPSRVDAPIRFENRSSVNQILGVSKTGCSCYGMATADAIWGPGELLTVPPGEAKEVFFVARELQGATEQAFRVGFHARPSVESSSSKGATELRADCSMKVFPDLVIEPASIVIDLPKAGESGSTGSKSHAITITRITRGKSARPRPPVFSMSPRLLTAEPAVQEKSPEEISAGLWRTVWKTSVRPDAIPTEIHENSDRTAFAFEFPDVDFVPTSPASTPRDGQIPTILDVVASQPQQKITGQLILRRSTGIIAPSQLHFGAIPMGSASRTRRLVLTAADHRPFEISVGDVPAQFSAAADSVDPAGQQWVTVTFQPGAAGDTEGKLILKTTHPEQPEITVTLKARVQ